jgi:uncharacterized damage-inducible protein DinB
VPIVDALLPEYDREIATTRKLLERLPDGRFDWKPHPKSYSLGDLATHLSNLPYWGQLTLGQSELDLGVTGRATPLHSRGDVVATFDRNAAATRAALVGRSDAELMAPWTLKHSGKTMFTMPKAAVWRSFVMNHLIHHRGQLSVYLRLNEVPLPSIYGPSADENPF